MRELRKRLEMLEEACAQLDKGSSTGGRLALILLDNLAEIMMYDKARHLFAHDSQWEGVVPRKYCDQFRKKVLWGFSEKVDLVVGEVETLSEDQGKILKGGHLLRNEAYHSGQVRERIIQDVARTYLGVVCHMLPALWSGVLTFDPRENVGGYLKQFGVDGSMISWDVLKSVCTHFMGQRGCSVEGLTASLSSDLAQRIEEVAEGCEYLAEGGHERVLADEVLKNLQFNPQFHEKHEFAQTDEGFREFVETREREYTKYIPPITLATLEEWKKRAEAISSIVLSGAALDEYLELDRAMSDISETVGRAVYEFDEWVNMQVHDRGL